MTPGKLSIDLEGTYPTYQRNFFDDQKNDLSVFDRQESVRFFMVDKIEKWLETSEPKEKKRQKLYKTITIVLTVVTHLLAALCPLGFVYLPLWVPLGIGFPVVVILALINSVLSRKEKQCEYNIRLAPITRKFLKTCSPNELHPLGIYDTPKNDRRCKSDLVAEHELKKEHPEPARDLEHTIGTKRIDGSQKPCIDLEVDTYVKKNVSNFYTDPLAPQENWKPIQTTMGDANKSFKAENPAEYNKLRCEAFKAAYKSADFYEFSVAKADKLESLVFSDFSFTTHRDDLASATRLYARFYLRYKEAKELYKHQKILYKPIEFQQAPELDEAWENLNKSALEAKNEVDQLAALLANPDAAVSDYAHASYEIMEKKLDLRLHSMMTQVQELEKKFETRIESHPRRLLQKCEKQLEDFQSNILSRSNLGILTRWLYHGPQRSTKYLIEFTKQDGLPSEIQEFLDANEEMQRETPMSFFRCQAKLRDRLDTALQSFARVKERLNESFTTQEGYNQLIVDINSFKKQLLDPIAPLIAKRGEESLLKFYVKSINRRLPPQPFVKETLPENPIWKQRKIEEYRLDDLLKKIDRKIIRAHNIKQYAVEMPLLLIMVVEVVLLIYIPNPLVGWGFSLLSFPGAGLSYYLKTRLEKMDKEKLAVKLQYLMQNAPDIGLVPGDCPKLEELKRIQQQYGLEGVRTTWARAIAEGDQIIPDSSLEAKKEIAEEGSKMAGEYLANVLPLYERAYTKLDPNSERAVQFKERIKDFREVLDLDPPGKVEAEKEELSLHRQLALSMHRVYEKLVQNQNGIDRQLDQVVDIKITLRKKIKNLKQISEKFVRLTQALTEVKKNEFVIDNQATLIHSALQGDQERTSDEQIDLILDEIKRVVERIALDGSSEATTQLLKEDLERLKLIPKETLCIKTVEFQAFKHKKQQLERQLFRLEKTPEYISKEHVDQTIASHQIELEGVEQKLRQLKEVYDQLDREIKLAAPISVAQLENDPEYQEPEGVQAKIEELKGKLKAYS